MGNPLGPIFSFSATPQRDMEGHETHCVGIPARHVCEDASQPQAQSPVAVQEA